MVTISKMFTFKEKNGYNYITKFKNMNMYFQESAGKKRGQKNLSFKCDSRKNEQCPAR